MTTMTIKSTRSMLKRKKVNPKENKEENENENR